MIVSRDKPETMLCMSHDWSIFPVPSTILGDITGQFLFERKRFSVSKVGYCSILESVLAGPCTSLVAARMGQVMGSKSVNINVRLEQQES